MHSAIQNKNEEMHYQCCKTLYANQRTQKTSNPELRLWCSGMMNAAAALAVVQTQVQACSGAWHGRVQCTQGNPTMSSA